MPPKLRPALPPKQTIDKSREDLAQIDMKFKSSLVELRSRCGADSPNISENLRLKSTMLFLYKITTQGWGGRL